MQFRRTFTIGFLLVAAGFAQTLEEEVRSKIATAHYAGLPEHARIQGDVHLNLNSGVVTILSGHPLLAPTAVESAKAFGSIQANANLDVTYHFVLVDTASSVPTWMTVKRGNAIERAVLRIFGLKTEKVVLDYRCQEGMPPANDVRLAGAVIEVWIYGRSRCLQTEAATLLATR